MSAEVRFNQGSPITIEKRISIIQATQLSPFLLALLSSKNTVIHEWLLTRHGLTLGYFQVLLISNLTKLRSSCSPGKSEVAFTPDWNLSQTKSAFAVKQPGLHQASAFQHQNRPSALFLSENDTSRYYLSYPGYTPYSPRLYSSPTQLSPQMVCVNDIFNPFRHVAAVTDPGISPAYKPEFRTSPERWTYVPTGYTSPVEATRFVFNGGQVR